MDIINTDEILKWIADSRAALAAEAEQVASMFWDHRDGMLEVKANGVTPILGCRVVSKENSLRIQWWYWKFYKRNGQTKRTNVYIKKPATQYSYSLTKLFNYALPGEYEAVKYCEREFAKIRRRSEALKKIAIQVHTLQKMLAEELAENEERVVNSTEGEDHEKLD